MNEPRQKEDDHQANKLSYPVTFPYTQKRVDESGVPDKGLEGTVFSDEGTRLEDTTHVFENDVPALPAK